jgi:hypothetical protein
MLVLLAVGLGGAAWGLVRGLALPDIAPPATTPADGVRAQQKIFEIVRRADARSARPDRVTLSERELNAFLSRHLVEVEDVALADPIVKLVGGGVIEFAARVPLRQLLSERPVSGAADLLPSGWLTRPVWLHVQARAVVERAASGPRRYLRIEVDRFRLGRQRLPVIALRVLLDPATLRILRWRLPETVEAVTVEPGAAVIRIAS